jgi:hypothetical protein
LVTSLQRRGEPWHCTWCNTANQRFSSRNDPATANIGDLAVDMASHGLEFKRRQPLAVRNWFRTYRIAWQDISAFEMPPLYGTLRKAGLRIHLLDSRVISATLYARGIFDSGRAARTVAEELEQLRRQRVPDAVTARQPPGAIS